LKGHGIGSMSVDLIQYMELALEEARRAAGAGEVPVGAVLVREDRVVARAHNETIASRDPSAHAEIVAIRRAAETLGNHRLPGTVLYVTLEPCLMCFGAIIQGRVASLVFGAGDPKMGGRELFEDGRRRGLVHGDLEITAGILEKETADLLKNFFQERRT